MKVQIKRRRDGPPTLTCVRADGTRTWTPLHPFFPEHDLTHLAVETVLEFREAFFGLIASGWEIKDFARPGTSKTIPPQAVLAEHIVGLFDTERAQGARLTLDEFNAMLADKRRESSVAAMTLSAEQLERIRALRSELISRWWSVVDGDTLELPFPFQWGQSGLNSPARETRDRSL